MPQPLRHRSEAGRGRREVRQYDRGCTQCPGLERAGHRLRLDPATTRAAYLENVATHQKTIRDAAGKLHVSHVLLNTSGPFDAALMNYLAARVGWK